MSILEGTIQKTIAGKLYSLSANFLTKAEANKEAKRIRGNKFEVRITREARGGFGDNRKVFKVWVRNPRPF